VRTSHAPQVVEIIEGGRVRVDVDRAKGVHPDGVLAVLARDDYRAQRLFVVSAEDEYCVARPPEYESSASPFEPGQNVVARR